MVVSDVYHAPEYNYVAALGPLRSASSRAHISLIVSHRSTSDECLIVQTSDMVFPNSPSTCDLVRPQERESDLSIHSIAGTSRAPDRKTILVVSDVSLSGCPAQVVEVWSCPCEVKRVCQLSLNRILN